MIVLLLLSFAFLSVFVGDGVSISFVTFAVFFCFVLFVRSLVFVVVFHVCLLWLKCAYATFERFD